MSNLRPIDFRFVDEMVDFVRGRGFPSRMFAVHDGIVYDCRTTTLGKSYHAFPYHGEMLRSLHDRLAQTQDAQTHFKAFKRWIAKHVKVIG